MDLAITISPDRLRAVLCLPARRHLELPLLKELLSRAGIRSGLNRDGLVAATQRSDEDREIILAVGEDATPGFRGGLEAGPGELPRPVKAGMELGPWLSPSPGRPGMGVDGEPIPQPPEEEPFCFGPGLMLREDGVLVVHRDGELRSDANGGLRVTPNGRVEREVTEIEVHLDSKAMTASIALAAGDLVSMPVLRAAMARAKVVFGIDPVALAQACGSEATARVLVLARGKLPVKGSDATLEFLVDEKLHVQIDDFDRVDYRELHRVSEVPAGAPLARIHAAQPGIPGSTVCGEVLPARAGRDVALASFIGEGVRVSPSDPLLLEAEQAGSYRRTPSGRLVIQNLLAIDGDIDLKSGNINTLLPVLVKGDVKAGFTLKSGADIIIMGAVEDARISAHGNLTVRGGILPGRSRVKAHGKIIARHISGREIKCHDIEVATSIRYSRILATGSVSAKEIIAGRLIAAGNLVCDTLGSIDEQHTQVQVGLNPYEEALFLSAQQEQGRYATEVVSLKERCKLLGHKMSQRGEHAALDGDDPLADDLRQALQDFSNACSGLAACEAVLTRHDSQMDESNRVASKSTVTVRTVAYPGVEVLIGEEARVELRERLGAARFTFRDGMLLWE